MELEVIMEKFTEYILCGLVLVMAVILIVMLTRLAAMDREIRDTRRETAQTLAQNYAAINQALADDELATEQRLEYLRSTMEGRLIAIQNDNNRQLERMRATVDEKLQTTLDDKLSRSFESVRQSLQAVYQGLGEMQNLASGVGDLKKVLTNIKSRGILGEIQLGSILEQILAPGQYEENVVTIPGSKERVEYAVKMPGDGNVPVLLPIDAKFPGDAYSNLLEAVDSGDPQAMAQCRRQLAYAVRKAARDISGKYICPPYSTDFAVMFLPFEGLYAEVVNMGLMEELQRDCHVMVAGPSTMAALLNSLQMGFRTLAIQKNAGRVWQVLGNGKTEFDKFGEVLTATQLKLDQANKELDKLVGTRTRMIQRSLRDVQDLKEPVEGGILLPPVDLEK
jgi:DNA recombination protein RmuC